MVCKELVRNGQDVSPSCLCLVILSQWPMHHRHKKRWCKKYKYKQERWKWCVEERMSWFKEEETPSPSNSYYLFSFLVVMM